jgi:hypothetical protein
MNAHPHPDTPSIRPLMGRQRPLHLQRAPHSLLRAGERDEKRVAFRAHLTPAWRAMAAQKG